MHEVPYRRASRQHLLWLLVVDVGSRFGLPERPQHRNNRNGRIPVVPVACSHGAKRLPPDRPASGRVRLRQVQAVRRVAAAEHQHAGLPAQARLVERMKTHDLS